MFKYLLIPLIILVCQSHLKQQAGNVIAARESDSVHTEIDSPIFSEPDLTRRVRQYKGYAPAGEWGEWVSIGSPGKATVFVISCETLNNLKDPDPITVQVCYKDLDGNIADSTFSKHIRITSGNVVYPVKLRFKGNKRYHLLKVRIEEKPY